MSETKNKPPTGAASPARDPLDLKHLRNLIELMVANDLSRLELREGDTHILLRRGHPVVSHVATPAHPAPAAMSAVTAVEPVQPAAASEHEVLIRSPMVGTFYAAPEPETPPFVNVGQRVSPDTVVCLIEAMKVFNDIKAEVTGEITKVLVKNASAVEYDQPLFAVRPA
jgi:acetyl-CoA carboxylase biotin carboxyl carrier protein